MTTTARTLSASVVAPALPWLMIGAAEAAPPLNLGQFEACVNKPALKDRYGVTEWGVAGRRRR